ncbi:MAG: hypothetical protein ACXVB0_14780 [Mucilaginibacter sp.]
MEEEIKEKKPSNLWKVVGYNILALFCYTLLCRFSPDGMFWDCFLIIVHVLVCIIAAVIVRRWDWILAAVAVILIGVSTCVTILPTFRIFIL